MGMYCMLFIMLQAQISTEGLEIAAKKGDINSILIWIVSIVSTLLLGAVAYIWNEYQRKTKQLEDSKDDYANKIEDLTRTHNNKIDDMNREFMKKLEDVRSENNKTNNSHNEILLKKVDEWNKQWAESEKYAMDVIKGLNSLIENGDIMTNNRHTQVIDRLGVLETNLLNGIKLLKQNTEK